MKIEDIKLPAKFRKTDKALKAFWGYYTEITFTRYDALYKYLTNDEVEWVVTQNAIDEGWVELVEEGIGMKKNAEYYGYKVGDKFKYKEGISYGDINFNFSSGDVLTLHEDDGSMYPYFINQDYAYGHQGWDLLEPITSEVVKSIPTIGEKCWVNLSYGSFEVYIVGIDSEGNVVFETTEEFCEASDFEDYILYDSALPNMFSKQPTQDNDKIEFINKIQNMTPEEMYDAGCRFKEEE